MTKKKTEVKILKVAHQLLLAYPWIVVRMFMQNKNLIWSRAMPIFIVSLLALPFTFINFLLTHLRLWFLKPVPDPLFVLGHWRGGTTYLHYLLALDSRFDYLNYYQGFVPNLTILGGRFLKNIVSKQTPAKRPQDDMRVQVDLPTEEENPLATFSTRSASQSFFFPKNEDYYDKYALFKGITKYEKFRWKRAYRHMMRRIRIAGNGKQLLIKNPHNTGRALELQEIYPEARFVHIHRDPFEVFPSTYLMYDRVVKTQFLQEYSENQIIDKIIYYYESIMGRYLEQRSQIEEKLIIDISYADFVADPMGEIDRIYKHFGWQLDPESRKRMQAYVDTKKNYKKNIHHIEPTILERLKKRWSPIYKELGYI